MSDKETIARFIFLRTQGWSFNRIAVDLNISKTTLIKWSRLHQFEIRNVRATETEGIIEKVFKTQQQRWEAMAKDLAKIEEEIDKRKLEDIPTAQLFSLASQLREKIKNQIGKLHFSETTSHIPDSEYVFGTEKWDA